MSIPQHAGGPIGSRDDLVRYLEQGSKPRADWRIGTEHEKFVYDLATHKPVPYHGRPGIRALLNGMRRFGWEPVTEGDNIIGLTGKDGAISLEPGGQFELSGAALKSVHETCSEVNTHQEQVREIANEIGAGVIGLGYAPTWRLSDVPMMPAADNRSRYETVSRLRVSEADNGRIVIETANVTPLRWLFTSFAAPGDVQTWYFLEHEAAGTWRFYSLTRVQYASRWFSSVIPNASYINRALAMYRYITGIPTDRDPPAAP